MTLSVSTCVTKALVRSRKVGGSLVVSIPRKVTEYEGIREGELLEIDVHKAKKDWFGAFKGIAPFTREDELDTHE
jgi:antitoxin component of MazEF toxin-antitoxin module